MSHHTATAELDELYRRYRPFIRGALQRHYVSSEELDDVTHDVFVVLLRKLDEASRPRSIKAWLFQIARRVAANHHRGARRRDRKGRALAAAAELEPQASPDDLAARQEARDGLAQFIESLDDEACAVFVMSEVEGLRGAEIASRLGISLPMTYARIRSVRSRFDERFGRKNAAWAALLGWSEAGVAAAITVAFAIGRKAKVVGAVVLALGLAWLLRSQGWGGSEAAPPPGVDSGAPPIAVGGDREAPPRAPSDASGADALEFVPRGKEGVFAGRVVDDGGRGIAGATVCGDRTRLPDHEQNGPPRCTRSDAEGRFSVKGLLAEAHTLAAMAPGLAPGSYHGPPADGIEIVLHAGGAELTGVVVDVYGGPIADAWVSVEDSGQSTLGVTARTDDEGRFSLWVSPGRVSLAAGAMDYASSFANVLAPTKQVELRLGAESIISGIVVDAQHRPVPDVRVSALLVPGPERYANRGGRTYSDATGKWEIRGLQPHEYILDAAGAQSWGRGAEPVDLGIGDHRTGIEIVMNEGAELIGRIVDAETGDPCADGFVTTLDAEQSITREGRTQHDGWVTVSSLTGDASYRLTVACRGYLSRELDIELGKGRNEPVEWPLSRGSTLAVKAVDGEGQPLADWVVMIRMPKGHRVYDHRPTRIATNVDGLAEFEGLPEGTYEVRLDGPTVGPEAATAVTLDGERKVVELQAREGVEVSGTVADQQGHEMIGALVTLQAEMPEISRVWGPTKEQRQQIFASGPYRAVVDATGAFRIARVPPGDYDVWVVPATSATGLMLPERLDNPFARPEHDPLQKVAVGAEPVSLKLVVETRPGIAGTVRDEENDAVLGARVFAVAEREGKIVSPRGRPSVADEEGQFAFDDLLPGKYTVTAYRPGGGVARRTGVEAGTTAAELVFPRLGRISGNVRDADGESVPVFNVFAIAEGSKHTRFIPMGSQDGSFTIGGLEAGRYTIAIETPTAKAVLEVELGAGDHETGLDVKLESRTRVIGRLVDADGEPLDGWDLGLIVAGSAREVKNVRVSGQTRSDGTFAFADVPVEPLALIAGPDPSPEAFAKAPELTTITPREGELNDLGDLEASPP